LVDKTALVEPHLAKAAPGASFQFQRIGYFVVDLDSTAAKPVFNRIVPLKEGDKPVPTASKPAK
jgi:glutaminyl-tRNA synthetase